MHRVWWQWNAEGGGGPLPNLHRLSWNRSDQSSDAIRTVEPSAAEHAWPGQAQLSNPATDLIFSPGESSDRC